MEGGGGGVRYDMLKIFLFLPSASGWRRVFLAPEAAERAQQRQCTRQTLFLGWISCDENKKRAAHEWTRLIDDAPIQHSPVS